MVYNVRYKMSVIKQIIRSYRIEGRLVDVKMNEDKSEVRVYYLEGHISKNNEAPRKIIEQIFTEVDNNNDFIVDRDIDPSQDDTLLLSDKINDKLHHLIIVNNMMSEMQKLINICKKDYQDEEATAIRDEFVEIVQDDPTIDSNIYKDIIKFVTRMDSMIFRSCLFKYKDRGFILADIGNGNWNYVCTAEEALVGFHYKQFGIEY